jgi:hypothetical protein
VVTADGEPDDAGDEFDDEDDVPSEDVVEPVDADEAVDDALELPATVLVFRASAGSLPVTSCTKIPPEVTRKVATASPATRLRIACTRARRARRRSATTVCGSGLGEALREWSDCVIRGMVQIERRR